MLRNNRTSVYEVITNRILKLLDQGTIPWKKPWGGADQAPKSLANGNLYRGSNVLLLHAAGYESPYWLTFRQAQEWGGQKVRLTRKKGDDAGVDAQVVTCLVTLENWSASASKLREARGSNRDSRRGATEVQARHRAH